MDRGTVPSQFAPSTSSKLGHNNALMYKLCPCQAQFMTILSFDNLTFKCDLDLQPTSLQFFFTKSPNLKKEEKKLLFFVLLFFFFFWGGGGGGVWGEG